MASIEGAAEKAALYRAGEFIEGNSSTPLYYEDHGLEATNMRYLCSRKTFVLRSHGMAKVIKEIEKGNREHRYRGNCFKLE